jgi:small redox-active disulfide protein 2
MEIKIYGTGCPKCTKLYELAELAVNDLGIEAELSKVSDIMEIMNAGIMTTPALAVNGEVKFSGSLPTREEIKAVIK